MHDSDLNVVYRAIEVFYSGQNNAQAAAWLSEFQKSVHAWTLCDQILGERKDDVACCFAAQTLRQKILKNLNEVPRESLESLRESLINHLSLLHVTDQVSEATATQLCLAVADLYIQIPEWVNFIASLLNRFTALGGDRTRMLLTLLKVFPEEVEQSSVGENRRKTVREELAINGDSVILYLSNVLQANIQHQPHDEEIIKKVVLCLSAFLLNPNVHTDKLASSDLLKFVFQILAAPTVSRNLHDAATECVVAALYRAEDVYAHRAFAVVLHQATFNLQTAFQEAVVSEDMDRLLNFARVFVELCESLIEPVVNQNKDTSPLHDLSALELLLLLAGHFDYSLIEMTFNVWYRISEALFMIDDDAHVALFKPYVARYLHALYRHSRYDTDDQGVPDQHSDFADFRLKVTETVKDVAFIIGTDECIKMMFILMEECAQKGNATWDETEAALFIVSNVIQNLLPEEDSIVPQLISQLVQLSSNSHAALLLTAIQFMGGCCEWLGKHPAMHDCVMNWLLTFVDNPVFASYVSESIEKICAQAPLTRFIPCLQSAIHRLEQTTGNAKGVENACLNITNAVAKLCNVLPPDELALHLKESIDPILLRLQIIVESQDVQTTDENKGDAWIQLSHRPVIWLDRLAAIFREIKPQQNERGALDRAQPPMWLPSAHSVWEVASRVIAKYEDKGRIIEHACRAVRHLVRALGMHSAGFVQPLVIQVTALYRKHQHSCILYLASILVDEYGAVPELQPGLLEMLDCLAVSSFPLLQKENGFRDNPETVDDLFRLAARYINRCPANFFLHSSSLPIFECGLHALHVDHPDANRQVTKYFTEMIGQLMSAKGSGIMNDGVQAARQLVDGNAVRIVENSLKAALFDVSSTLRRDMAEIICLLGKYDKELQEKALQEALTRLPRGPLCATDEQLQRFYECVVKEPDTRGVNGHIRDLVKLYT